MTFNPYEVLDVPRDASQTDISRAYKRKAKIHHPDKGGDRDDFEKLVQSNMVLSDPKKRSKYDTTGKIDEEHPDNTEGIFIARAIAAILQAADAADKHGEPTLFDLVQMAKEQINKDILATRQNQTMVEINAKRVENIASKMLRKSKDGQPDFVVRGIQRHAGMMREAIEKSDIQIVTMQGALKILEDYDFVKDVQQAVTTFYVTTR
jgi:curved DNA-binding protein CbpA